MKNMNINTTIPVLGPARIPSPLGFQGTTGDGKTRFIKDEYRISVDVRMDRIFEEPKTIFPALNWPVPGKKFILTPANSNAPWPTAGGCARG